MKKSFVMLLAVCTFSTSGSFAKGNNEEAKIFEEAYARNIEPQGKIYIKPQTCDLQYLSTEIVDYGPYIYTIDGSMDEYFLENAKNRAIYQACKEENADMLVGAMFDSYITADNPKILKVELRAYPVKFVNFRALGETPNDYEMVRTVYPSAMGVYEKQVEELKNTGKKAN